MAEQSNDSLTVVISSTARDLPEHRREVMDACMRLGHRPKMMEHLPAADADAIEESLALVAGADVYLGIFAHRYGFVPPGFEVSITEMEYHRAKERGVPSLIFFMHQDHPIKAGDVETGEGAARLARLKDKIGAERVSAFFKSPEDLRAHVLHALGSQVKRRPPTPSDPDLPPQPKVRLRGWPEVELPEEPYPLLLPYTHPANLWNVPFERNPFFTGRDDVLEELREALTRTPRALTINGLGGIGKTQTAVEYAYRYREHYDAVFWVAAETVDDLETGYVEIARRLDLPEQNSRERQTSVRAVLRWLETNASWLLILDNADTPQDLKGRLPAEHQGHIILTSRARSFGRLARPLRLSTLPPAQAEAFLLRRAQRVEVSAAEQEAVTELARELGYLPLALEQAGAYVEDTGTAFQTYLTGFRRRRLKLLDEATAPEEHPPVATTWEMNFAEIEKASAASADLLRVCGFLAPDSIPVELLVQGAPELGSTLAAALENATEDELRLDELLRPLRRYSLIQRDVEARTFSIHRLVQEAVKARMDEDTRRRWGQRVVNAVARVFPGGSALNSKDWRRAERLFLQGRAAVRLVDRWSLESSETSLLLNQLGVCARYKALYHEAESFCRKALAMRRQQPAAEHPRVVDSLLSLAMVLNWKGAYEEAETLCREALAISRRQRGAEPRDVAESLCELGDQLIALGAYEEAERLLREALALLHREVGDEHLIVVTSCLYDLGFICYRKGVSLAEAEQNLRQASAISRRLALPFWPMVQSLLVCLLCLKGAYKEAGTLGREVLEAVRQQDDEIQRGEHRDMPASPVALSLLHLAVALFLRESYEEAEQLFREALAILRREVGDEHFLVAISMSFLARLLVIKGAHGEAERFCNEALAIQRRPDGEHPDLALGLTSLALLRVAQGRYVAAEELLRQALKIQRQIFPSDSFWIALDEGVLGDALAGQERYQEAETLLVESLTVVRDKAGDRSPLTRQALESLVKLYEAWGKAEKAAEYRALWQETEPAQLDPARSGKQTRQ